LNSKIQNAIKLENISNLITSPSSYINLNRAEEEALQDLLSDQSIVIRTCDKGSGVCVINTEDYVHKIENELQDSSTYKQVEKYLTEEITKKVEKTNPVFLLDTRNDIIFDQF
jgi:predicted molibdopterin-dependent oxidoreductase YjgC